MQRVLVLVLLLCFTSCNYFNVKKTSSEEILAEELEAFNWNEIDVYPSFKPCDSLPDNIHKKSCFEKTIIQAVNHALSEENFVVTKDVEDTIWIQFQISEKGVLQVTEIKMDALTKQEIPNIETILEESLHTLPEIFPGIKRGQQVRTQFTMPIKIEVH